ncbi:Unknown protein, partial [Striga hermonthica]
GEVDSSPPSAQVDTSNNTATRNTESVPVQTVPRRSGSVSQLPDQWLGLGQSKGSVPVNLELDPRTYNEALEKKDADSLKFAMNAEMGSDIGYYILKDKPAYLAGRGGQIESRPSQKGGRVDARAAQGSNRQAIEQYNARSGTSSSLSFDRISDRAS